MEGRFWCRCRGEDEIIFFYFSKKYECYTVAATRFREGCPTGRKN